MPTYSYNGTDSTGQPHHGTIDAESMDAARDALASQSYLLQSITEEQPSAAIPLASLQISDAIPTKESVEPEAQVQVNEDQPEKYFPIAATLRLYAGWLLAYYALVYAVGWYSYSRPLPFEIPFVQALLLSPIVLSFTLAAYLFLIFQSLYKASGEGLFKGILMSVLGIGTFLLYRMNVV